MPSPGLTSRRADLVLAGHTHHHNEISIRAEEGDRSSTWTTTRATRAALTPTTPSLPMRSASARTVDWTCRRWQVYVEIDDLAVASASPWPMPGRRAIGRSSSSRRTRTRWTRPPIIGVVGQHKPLRLQTGAVGLWENQEVSFSGFRLIRLRDNVIERIDFVSRIRLDESGWSASLAEVTAPRPAFAPTVPRSDRVAHPRPQGRRPRWSRRAGCRHRSSIRPPTARSSSCGRPRPAREVAFSSARQDACRGTPMRLPRQRREPGRGLPYRR